MITCTDEPHLSIIFEVILICLFNIDVLDRGGYFWRDAAAWINDQFTVP
jgi:hypothetical protein